MPWQFKEDRMLHTQFLLREISQGIVRSMVHVSEIMGACILYYISTHNHCIKGLCSMVLLPDTQNCGLCMRRKCRERFPRYRLQSKPLVRDPGMHHGTCITHVPWCMSGSVARSGGENVPGNPKYCASGKRPMHMKYFCHLVQSKYEWYYHVGVNAILLDSVITSIIVIIHVSEMCVKLIRPVIRHLTVCSNAKSKYSWLIYQIVSSG